MTLRENFNQLFHSEGSFAVFLLYLATSLSLGLLVKASSNGANAYSYNTITVVLLCELAKLVLSSAIYLRDNTLASLVESTQKHRDLFLLYLVPAGLYCVYNNLYFVSLIFFDPTSNNMFMQIRLILTGIIYQVIFKRMLSLPQWGSLILLTIGCVLQAAGTLKSDSFTSYAFTSLVAFGLGMFFVVSKTLCSVFAGVYNEFLLKDHKIDVMIQNVFLYLHSILWNVLLLGVKGDLAGAFTLSSLSSICQPIVICIIINISIHGILVSLLLQKLNSILKAFASAIELCLTAILSWPLLGIPLTLHTVVALCVICSAVVIYAQNPVTNVPVKVEEDGSQLNGSQKNDHLQNGHQQNGQIQKV